MKCTKFFFTKYLLLALLIIMTTALFRRVDLERFTAKKKVAPSCILCGDSTLSGILPYVGQHNLGILSLNSGEFCPLELISYEELDEDPQLPALRFPDGTISIRYSSDDDGYQAYTTLSPDNKEGTCSLTVRSDKTIYTEKYVDMLCDSCRKTIKVEKSASQISGLCLINLSDMSFHVLSNASGEIATPHYQVRCSTSYDNNHKIQQIDLRFRYIPQS